MMVIKVFSTSEEFLKQEMDHSVPSHTGLYKVIKGYVIVTFGNPLQLGALLILGILYN